MKKILLFFLVALLSLSLAGCGNPTAASNPGEKTGQQSQEKSTQIRQEFDALAAKQASPSDLNHFLSEKIKETSPRDAEAMLNAFIDAQRKSTEITDRFDRLLAEKPENGSEFFAYLQAGRDLSKLKNPELAKLMKDAADAGYILYAPEGMAAALTDYTALEKQYGSYLSQDFRDYLRFSALESDRPTSQDAGLMIPWDDLADRLNQAEQYMDQYPDSPYREKVKVMYGCYLTDYMIGQNNTPAFTYDTNTLTPETKKSYYRMVEKYKGSRAAQVISQYLKVLEKNDFKRTAEVEAFIKDQLGS